MKEESIVGEFVKELRKKSIRMLSDHKNSK